MSMRDVLEQAPPSSRRTRKAAIDARVRAMVDEHSVAVYYALRCFGVPDADLEDCTQQVFMEQRRLRALFDEVLEAMPEELRAVLVLYEVELMRLGKVACAFRRCCCCHMG
jgi:DNA-directed RNA polymerase specialized sigma24 family protein